MAIDIVANSADSEEAVWRQLALANLSPADHCSSYAEGPEDTILGAVIWRRCTSEQKASFWDFLSLAISR